MEAGDSMKNRKKKNEDNATMEFLYKNKLLAGGGQSFLSRL